MSNDDDGRIPLEECMLPGTVMVTPRALDLAERFQASVPTGWIAAFVWIEGRRFKAHKDAPWVDEGPGLDLGAYRIGQIPEEAIYRSGSFRYAVLIREEIVSQHAQRTIDLDESGRVVLR